MKPFISKNKSMQNYSAYRKEPFEDYDIKRADSISIFDHIHPHHSFQHEDRTFTHPTPTINNTEPTQEKDITRQDSFIHKVAQHHFQQNEHRSNRQEINNFGLEIKHPSIQYIVMEHERSQQALASAISDRPLKLQDIFAGKTPYSSQQIKTIHLAQSNKQSAFIHKQLDKEIGGIINNNPRNGWNSHELSPKQNRGGFAQFQNINGKKDCCDRIFMKKSIQNDSKFQQPIILSRQSSKRQINLIQDCMKEEEKVKVLKYQNVKLQNISLMLDRLQSGQNKQIIKNYLLNQDSDIFLFKFFLQKQIASKSQ